LVNLVVLSDESEPERSTLLPAALASAMPLIFVESTLPLAILDADGRLLAVNSGFATLVGRNAAGLTGERYADLVHPDDRLTHLASWGALFGGRLHSDQVRTRLTRPDGTALTVVIYRNVIAAPGSATPLGVAAVHDETRPEGADRAKELAAVARRLVETLGDDEGVANAMATGLAEAVGDLAAVWLLDEEHDLLLPAGGWHRDPTRRAALESILASGPRGRSEGLIARVVGLERMLRLNPSDVDLHRPALHPSVAPYVDAYGLAALVIVPLRSEDRVVGVLSVARDRGGSAYDDDDVHFVTLVAELAGQALQHARRLAGRAEATEHAHAQAVLDAMSVGTCVLDAPGRIIGVNAAWERAVERGGPIRATVGDEFAAACAAAESEGVLGGKELMSAARELLDREGETYDGDCGYHREDGTEAWCHIEITPLVAGGAVVTQVDVTERKQLEIALAHEATHDALTGLPNRTLLADRIELALIRDRRAGLRTAVLYCDLDHFKEINDEYGHDYGDAVLRAVADRFTDTIRASDTVARIGGDEFVVLIEAVGSVEEALVVADKLVLALIEPDREVQPRMPLLPGVSVGVAMSTMSSTADSLMREADAAMYAAKKGGRSRVEIAGDTV
jgi:diguanylate cyclase (GGDEF)-like protein/PAS domain S-box-containing protein